MLRTTDNRLCPDQLPAASLSVCEALLVIVCTAWLYCTICIAFVLTVLLLSVWAVAIHTWAAVKLCRAVVLGA